MDPESLGFKYMFPRTIVAGFGSQTMPAQKAGLQPGDEILSVRVKRKEGTGYDEILNIIAESNGVPLQFEIRRPSGSASIRRSDWDTMIREFPRNATIHTLHDHARSRIRMGA